LANVPDQVDAIEHEGSLCLRTLPLLVRQTR
jgi:hypothetical protein